MDTKFTDELPMAFAMLKKLHRAMGSPLLSGTRGREP